MSMLLGWVPFFLYFALSASVLHTHIFMYMYAHVPVTTQVHSRYFNHLMDITK